MISIIRTHLFFVFFFNDTATTEIYTLSLHDALPISRMATYNSVPPGEYRFRVRACNGEGVWSAGDALLALTDRKSTRLNSSHANISYAVFCLKKKKNQKKVDPTQSYTIYYHTYYDDL